MTTLYGSKKDFTVSVGFFVPDEIRSAAEQHGWTVNILA